MPTIDRLIAIHERAVIAKNYRPKTKEWYRDNLKAFANWLRQHPDYTGDVNDITKSLMNEYLVFLLTDENRHHNVKGTTLSHTSVINHYRCLKSFSKRMYDDEVIERDFMRKVEKPEIDPPSKKVLTPEQFMSMLEAARLGRNGLRDEALLLLLLDTGLRREEVRTLTLANVSLERLTMIVTSSKRKDPRSVGMSGATALALQRYLLQRGTQDATYVFLTDAGEQFSEEGLYQVIRRIGKRAGIEVNPHAFRHTFATSMLLSGASTLVVQSLLGHKKPDVTMQYFHMTNSDAQRVHEQHSPVAKFTANV